MARINLIDTIPVFDRGLGTQAIVAGSTLSMAIQQLYFPGSLSFNNVGIMITGTGADTLTVTFNVGLYSLNGSTLSLANSASASTVATNAAFLSWLTLITSAAQDITPGEWYLGFFGVFSSGGFGVLPIVRSIATFTQGVYGGSILRGVFSTATAAFPASIATSDVVKEGISLQSFTQPYILISA